GQAGLPPGGGGGDLDGEKPFGERGMAGVVRSGVVEFGRQGLGGGGQAQPGEVAAQAPADRSLAHRVTSARSAQSVRFTVTSGPRPASSSAASPRAEGPGGWLALR